MSFFNPKTDILDVKLNTYGVQLFSYGKLKPVYFIPTDSGMIYEDYDLDSEFREYIREWFAFLRPQRDTSFDTSVQNFDYFFENVSPCSIGTALDTYVEDEKRTVVPNFVLNFGSGLVSSAIKESSVIYVTLNDIETKFKKVVLPNESNIQPNVFEKNGGYYQFQEDYLFLDVIENGVEFSKENFWLLVYEKYGLEYKQIDLEESFLSEYGMPQSNKDVENDIIIKIDNKIDELYLCRHAEKINDNNNIYITNKGTINVDLMGKMCKDGVKSNSLSKVYVNRKEKDLGDQC